jgi:hypothetical protein
VCADDAIHDHDRVGDVNLQPCHFLLHLINLIDVNPASTFS